MTRSHYEAIAKQFAEQIRSGQLAPGTRLPTHRQLAQTHGIALATATRIYAELHAMGLASGETGRGTFVREPHLPLEHGIVQTPLAQGVMDMNFNASVLPGQVDALREALRKLASSGDLEAMLRYQAHGGRMHERSIVANHLARQGVHAAPDQVAIVSGAQHGLSVTTQSLLQQGDVVAVDALTYPGFKIAAQTRDLELAPVSVTRYGTDLDQLEKLCTRRKVRAVYTMPSMHNPLGCVMGLQARKQLVAIARKFNLILIEDAAYAFLCDTCIEPLFALAPERCVHVSGLSKSVASGLRLGYIAAPKPYMERIELAIRASTWNTPALMTALGCTWIQDGTAAHMEKAHRDDAHKRQVMVGTCLKGFRMLRHPNSYFTWLPLEEDMRADQLVHALALAGILASTADPFSTTAQAPQAIRLALGTVPLEALQTTLQRVRKVLTNTR